MFGGPNYNSTISDGRNVEGIEFYKQTNEGTRPNGKRAAITSVLFVLSVNSARVGATAWRNGRGSYFFVSSPALKVS
jgi:hypothetical protein